LLVNRTTVDDAKNMLITYGYTFNKELGTWELRNESDGILRVITEEVVARINTKDKLIKFSKDLRNCV